jgi:hypothetical protein
VSLTFLAVSLSACFTVVIASWANEKQSAVVALGNAPVAIGRPVKEAAEIVPATFQTGSIHSSQRAGVTY